MTYLDSKSVYIDKNLMKDIKSQLDFESWTTVEQKKLLIKHIENRQTHLSVLSICRDSL